MVAHALKGQEFIGTVDRFKSQISVYSPTGVLAAPLRTPQRDNVMEFALALLLVLSALNTAAIVVIVLLKLRETGIRRVMKPSTELADFLDDVKLHGFGVIRLDPDSLLARRVR